MQYDVKTPTEYMKLIETPWQKERISYFRKLIKKQISGVKETINYKMLCYEYKGDKIFHLNAQKSHVGLYVCDTKLIDKDGSLLKGIDTGKGCIRFKKTTEVSESNIIKLIHNAVMLSDKGIKSSC